MVEPSDAELAAVEAVDPDEVVRFARALVAAPSENPGGTEDDAADVAAGILADLDLSPQTVRSPNDRPSVTATVGGQARPRLAWNGHLDVVPAGEPSTWTHAPYDATVVDGRLVGRGAADMKGPIASALAAVAALGRAKVELGGALDLHLAADEEHTGTEGTAVLLANGALTQDACIVGEPSELQLGLAERGGAWVHVESRGRAAHGSQPHRGANAITAMARLLLRLEDALPDLEHPLVGRPTINPSMITGGTARNVVPDRCFLTIDRRTIPGETSRDEVLAPFERLAAEIAREHPETDLRSRVDEWTEAAETTPDSEIATICRGAVAAEAGAEPLDVGFTGITDARFYINDASIPTVIMGPGSLSVAHTANESVAVDELVAAARIYVRAFVRFLSA
jgi:succinyl-diaminopimelate desuccinylase